MMSKAEVIRVQAGPGKAINWSGISHVLICFDVDEMPGFLSRYASSFPDPGRLLVFCVGLIPSQKEITFLATSCKNRKVLIVFQNDLLGRVVSIKIAVWLKNKDVRITYLPSGEMEVVFQGIVYVFALHKLSLSAFEKASGFRSKVRTRKLLTRVT